MEITPQMIEFVRLSKPTTRKDVLDSYNNILNTGMRILDFGGEIRINNAIDHDAHLLYQMTLLKCLSIRTLYQDHTFISDIGGNNIPNILDPMSMWAIVRAQFEALCNFNNIYLQTSTLEERDLVHSLWVISGLKYRQKFETGIMTPENVVKKEKEAQEIIEITNHLKSADFFKSLQPREQMKIDNYLKDSIFQVYFKNGKLLKGGWTELMQNAGAKDMYKGMYNMMSLSTHPSNVSVFQFRDLYKNNMAQFSTDFLMKFSSFITACLIRDFCEYFPCLKNEFRKLPKMNQHLINGFNRLIRGNDYVLNDLVDFD